MPILYTWPQLAASVALATFFLFLTFSRTKPMAISTLIPLSTCWLLLGTQIWFYILKCTYWQGGETIFRFGIDPFLPALVVYGSAGASAVLFITIPIVLIWQKAYSMRQRIAYVLAALTISSYLAILAISPWRLQHIMDGMGIGP